jgi:hypothetical protein
LLQSVLSTVVPSTVLPASAVTEISDGQEVHRRVGAAIGLTIVSFGIGALMALGKSKKYFVSFEGVTGKKAVGSDAMTVKH